MLVVCDTMISMSKPSSRLPPRRMPTKQNCWNQKNKWWEWKQAVWSATDSTPKLVLSSREDEKTTLEAEGCQRVPPDKQELPERNFFF